MMIEDDPVAGPSPGRGDVTDLLQRWKGGDHGAVDVLLPLVYDDMLRIARRLFRRERADHTLEPTALVHEVFMELDREHGPLCKDRSHFYALTATLMRRALVDHSRGRSRLKRGGANHKLALDEIDEPAQPQTHGLLALENALQDLERLDPVKARIVELRFYTGLSVEETAACIRLSSRTLRRHWRQARALLYRELAPQVRDAL